MQMRPADEKKTRRRVLVFLQGRPELFGADLPAVVRVDAVKQGLEELSLCVCCVCVLSRSLSLSLSLSLSSLFHLK